MMPNWDFPMRSTTIESGCQLPEERMEKTSRCRYLENVISKEIWRKFRLEKRNLRGHRVIITHKTAAKKTVEINSFFTSRVGRSRASSSCNG